MPKLDVPMLRAFRTPSSHASVREFVPAIVTPIERAAARAEDLTDTIQHAVRGLGFDAFTYAVAMRPDPAQETRAWVWTSLPDAWMRLYDGESLIETDPRLAAARASNVPLVWDRTTFADTPRHRAFFAAADRFGVRSGVAIALRHSRGASAIFTVDCGIAAVDAVRRRHVAEQLGQLMVLSAHVHELHTAAIVDRGVRPPTQGRPLNPREQQCLQLAARGLTPSQIAASLDVDERTVRRHFGNLLAKLGAANRHEAVARSVAAGTVMP
jgi:DNA-binding CsgD family transcriptional regulator